MESSFCQGCRMLKWTQTDDGDMGLHRLPAQERCIMSMFREPLRASKQRDESDSLAVHYYMHFFTKTVESQHVMSQEGLASPSAVFTHSILRAPMPGHREGEGSQRTRGAPCRSLGRLLPVQLVRNFHSLRSYEAQYWSFTSLPL